MLKIIYTDAAPYLEHLTQSVEDWIASHTVLALRMGQPWVIEPGKASLLWPIGFSDLVQEVLNEARRSRVIHPAIAGGSAPIELCCCDDHSLELSFTGLWVAANGTTHTGQFVTALGSGVEQRLFDLWLQTQSQVLLR